MINCVVECNGGSISGNQGTLALYSGGQLINSGTLAWNGNVLTFPGALVSNLAGATINMPAISSAGVSGPDGGPGSFSNAGQLTVAGTGTATIAGSFYNSGTVSVTSGELDLDVNGASPGSASGAFTIASGATLGLPWGTLAFNAGSSISGAGTFAVFGGTANFAGSASMSVNRLVVSSGAVNFNQSGTVAAGALNLSGGTVAGTGLVGVSGPLSWTGGMINGVVECNGGSISGNQGTLALYSGGQLINSGTLAWNGNVLTFPGALVSNLAGATINLPANNSAGMSGLDGGAGSFSNAGQLTVAGTGIATIAGSFNNSGTVSVQSGTLNLSGSYNLTSGILNFGISSLTDFGQITLAGSTTLTGTVSANLNNGYVPVAGNSFAVLSYGDETGIFTNQNLPLGAIWRTNYTATSLVLTSVGQIIWATPSNITYGTALGASQLNASTTPSVAGTFTYNPVAGTVLNSGVQWLTATFAPSDPGEVPASFQVPITVLPAPLAVTATNQTKTYGQAFSFAGTQFVSIGLVNGDTVTNASLVSDGAISNAPVSGSPYAIAITNALGDAGLTNYIITYSNGMLTINPAPLTITASPQTNTYGQTVLFGSGSALFTSVGLQNGETIESVTLAVSNNGGVPTAPVSGSPYTITPSAATGGTFAPGNYAITYDTGNLTVNPAALTVTATGPSKTYGTALTAGTSAANFTRLGDAEWGDGDERDAHAQWRRAVGHDGGGLGYTVTPSLATGGNGFLAANYNITYTPYSGTVGQAALTVTATGPSKTYGTALTAGTSAANFTRLGHAEWRDGDERDAHAQCRRALGHDGGGLRLYGDAVAGDGRERVPGGQLQHYLYALQRHGGPGGVDGDGDGAEQDLRHGADAGPSTANFTASATQNGETVTSVTLTPNAAGLSATTAAGLSYTVTPSLATGGNGFLAANYNITYTPYSGTVGQAALTVTATGPSKTYGTALTTGPSTANFTASATQNGETVTSVTLTPNAAGLSATTAAGLSYTVTPSLATGGNGFLAANYNITYAPYNGTVGQAALTVTATGPSKTYGTALTTGPSTANFTASATQNGETVTSVTLTPNAAGLSATTAAGLGYTVTPSLATGGNGFLAANYNITYNAYNGTVGQAALTITANSTNKIAGETLTFAGTEFTAGGLQNSETIGTVTLTSAGASSSAAAGPYDIVPSAPSGGTFSQGNYSDIFVDGTLTVLGPPVLTLTALGNQYVLTFPSVSGQMYQLQSKTNLAIAGWSALGGPITGTGGTVSVTNTIAGPQSFFKLQIAP